ncbi:MAG: HAD hydrolase family protein [Paenibacillaceae bacterium]|nr:HAD hydrolase family protein [Paenibacillaceae bacterium]
MTRPFPKLFVTDLDGTALGGGYRPYARFPDHFAAFLDQLAGRGCGWATCTTWELPPQLNLLHASAVQTPPTYVVGGSGLYLTRPLDGTLVKVQPYMGEMERRLAEAVQAELYPLMRDTASRFDPEAMSFNGYWYAMTALDRDAERLLAFMEEQAQRRPELRIETIAEERRFYAHPAFLRKGTAVREMARLLGLTPDDIVVAGDERMDLSMMAADVATHAICPANAHEEVKERVRATGGFVGEAVCSDGVIGAFRQLAEANGWGRLPVHDPATGAGSR